MNVFWRFGYEHTSLEVLMREMRIAKQSLYDTFGDKRALYLKALRQYRDNDTPGCAVCLLLVTLSKMALRKFCLGSAANRERSMSGAAYYSARIWNAMQKIES